MSIASVAVLIAAVGSFVAYAASEPGFSAHHADLNDGGIWVTRGNAGLFGRVNKPISQLDGAVSALGSESADGADLDVLQDGAAIVAENQSLHQAYPIDAASQTANSNTAVTLPSGAVLGMGGGVLAMLDPAKGVVRAMTYDPDSELSDVTALTTSRPLAKVGKGGTLAVSTTGVVFTVSASQGLTTINSSAQGFDAPSHHSLDNLEGTLSITAVGGSPVVLAVDNNHGRIIRSNGASTSVDGSDPVLQQAGDATDHVLVATARNLLSIPLSAGDGHAVFTGGPNSRPALPAFVNGCSYVAWPGSAPTAALGCRGGQWRKSVLNTPATRLVWRVNHEQVLLNDPDDGNTWNVDSGVAQQVANWKTVTPTPKNSNQQHKQSEQATSQKKALPPKPKDDDLGARPGVLTSLYVLDNDADPSGEVMAITGVSNAGAAKSWLSIAPDAQSVNILLPRGTAATTTFTYTVNTRGGGSKSAVVTVHAVQPSDPNSAPVRRIGAQDRSWTAPVNGTISIPVLGDWRDYHDGDAVLLSSASATGGQALATTDGSILYQSPGQPGKQTIKYTVVDGHGGQATRSLDVTVAGFTGRAVAPIANPDYAAGQVGSPVTFFPLDNDLPGFDPTSKTAKLTLVNKVTPVAGVQVTTDIATGAVTVRAGKPLANPSVVLSYEVGYGSAPESKGTIRVDISASSKGIPTTSPVTAVVRGQAPVDVDVLASDSDPNGGVLAIQRATPTNSNDLAAGVVNGAFVRVVPRNSAISPATQTVDYTVTDGQSTPVQGQIIVTQLPSLPQDTPITLPDAASVRAGQAVSIPVLDNDVAPDGDPLTLKKSLVEGLPRAGQLAVAPNVGAAFVSTNTVRYVAPTNIKVPTTVSVTYWAQNADQQFEASGTATVTVFPVPTPKAPDQAPRPSDVTARVVAGDTIVVKIPTTGVDPDGDTVTVVALGGTAPALGRITTLTPSSVSYQAFPRFDNGGTDTFTYVVSDTYGATATGTVRVAVVPPGDVQAPLPADDDVTVAPGADVRVDALANDLVAPNDTVTMKLLPNPFDTKVDARLLGKTGPVEVKAGTLGQAPVRLTYTLSDGVATSAPASITVHTAAGADLPPVVADKYAKPGVATQSVSLLTGAYDPDGDQELRVVSPASARSGSMPVTLHTYPQAIPFEVRDDGGATAAAVVYVPALETARPTSNRKTVTIQPGTSQAVDVRKYVTVPPDQVIRVGSTLDHPMASPSDGFSVAGGADQYHLVLTAFKRYTGPAAMTFEVINRPQLTDPSATKTWITVPVQIGPEAPVLQCSSTRLPVFAGGDAVHLVLRTLCHVWLPRPDFPFVASAAWRKPRPNGVEYSASADVITVTALKSAAGGNASLDVWAGKSNHQPVNLLIYPAPSTKPTTTKQTKVVAPPIPTLSLGALPPVSLKQGSSTTVNVGAYVSTRYEGGTQVHLVSASGTAGIAAAVTGTSLTLTAGANAAHGSGTVSFRITDATGAQAAARSVTAAIAVTVLGKPAAPTGLTTSGRQAGQVGLTWLPPADNGGSPITSYRVACSPSCPTSTVTSPAATVTTLHNGTAYTFQVYAVNAIGQSPASNSVSATPDAIPNAPTGVRITTVGDKSLGVAWDTPTGNFSAPTNYQLAWSPVSGSAGSAGSMTTSDTQATAGNLDNDSSYSFTVVAVNEVGPSPASAAATGQSAGAPDKPGPPSATAEIDNASHKADIQVAWNAVDPNGPGTTHYTVQRSDGKTICNAITSTSCSDGDVALDGSTYSYQVSAANEAPGSGHDSGLGPASPTVEASGTPEGVTAIQTNIVASTPDGRAPITYNVGNSNGKTSTVTCSDSNGGSCGIGSQSYSTTGASGSATLALAEGFDGSFALKQCNGGSDATKSCATSSSTHVAVNGHPDAPSGSVSCSTSGQTVTLSWNAGKAYGARQINYYALSGVNTDGTNGPVTTYSYTDSQTSGAQFTVTVATVDNNNERSNGSASGTCTHPQQPIFTVSHSGTCNYKPNGCENVYVSVSHFNAYSTVYCRAAGVRANNWSHTYNVDSNGNAPPYNGYLFDTDSGRFVDGNHNAGDDAGGLTCTQN